MRDLALGLGLVAIVEGLVLALAPRRLAGVVEMLRRRGRFGFRVFSPLQRACVW